MDTGSLLIPAKRQGQSNLSMQNDGTVFMSSEPSVLAAATNDASMSFLPAGDADSGLLRQQDILFIVCRYRARERFSAILVYSCGSPSTILKVYREISTLFG